MDHISNYRATTAALLIVAFSLVGGCASAQKAALKGTVLDKTAIEAQTTPALEVLRPALDVTKNSNGTYDFTFSASASGGADTPPMQALRSIRRVSFVVRDRSGNAVDSMQTTDIPTSGIATSDGGAALTAVARIIWAPRTIPPYNCDVIARAECPVGTMLRMEELPAAAAPARPIHEMLTISLDVEQRGSMVEFVMSVERNSAASPDEFLPSGETYRIEVFGNGGLPIWSSSAGQMFIQAIGPVVPEGVGEKVTYRAMFDGMNDETHARLAPGTYRVVATVPAKPKPYVLREEFTWGG